MKRRIRWTWNLGLAFALLQFVGGYPQNAFSQPADPVAEAESDAAPEETNALAASVAEPAPATDDTVNAPAKPISTDKPLPPGIQTNGPLSEVLKLVDSGVDESVLLAFVTNSPGAFRLSADQIIYLNDIGVPGAVVTAMLQRDQALQTLAPNAVAVAAAPEPAVPPPAPAEAPPNPAPGEVAPQPDVATGAYPMATDTAYAPFYDSLAPYGTWVDVDGYGPCWQPTVVVVNAGWRPYCDGGRWVYTDCGWYWQSGYSWGWAPFHYGRWFRHSHYGWCWQPGNVWGPSWVAWRYNGSYCGWAALPPAAGFSAGIGLTFHGQRVSSSFGFGLGAGSFTFVAMGNFANHHPNHYAVPHSQAAQVYAQTTPAATIVGGGTHVVNHGVPVSQVELASHTRIHRASVREGTVPGSYYVRGAYSRGGNSATSATRQHSSQPAGAQTPGPGRIQSASGGHSSLPPATARENGNSAPRIGAPLILRGSDRSRETASRSGGGSHSQTSPASSLIVIGKRDSTTSHTSTRTSSSAWQSHTPYVSPAQQSGVSRTVPTERRQSSTPAVTENHWQRTWASPRAAESHVRTERNRQFESWTPPSRTEVPRNPPATFSVPRQTHSAPAPVASPAPRSGGSDSRPAFSPPSHSFAPAAPAHSSPAPSGSFHSSPSSGRNGR